MAGTVTAPSLGSLLVLGGTGFLGRAITGTALDQGATVTHVNRRRTDPQAFANRVETITADRDQLDIGDRLRDGWDVAMDLSGYRRDQVARTAFRRLAAHYLFVSTCLVYEAGSRVLVDADDTYQGRKVSCEQLLAERELVTTVIRPGVIIGPYDPSGRVEYWLRAIAAGVTPPHRGDQPIQLVDVRDVACFMLTVARRDPAAGRSVAFDACGPTLRLDEFVLQAHKSVSKLGSGERRRLAETFVPRVKVPLTTEVDSDEDFYYRLDVDASVRSGLHRRPLEESLSDTLDHLLATS